MSGHGPDDVRLAWELIDERAEEIRTGDPDFDEILYTDLTVDQLNEGISDELESARHNVSSFYTDWAAQLLQSVMLRDAVLLVGEDAVRVKYPLPAPEPEPEDRVFRDGSRASQVVREEVWALVDNWTLHPVETLLGVLEWSDAARDAFNDAFQLRYGQED